MSRDMTVNWNMKATVKLSEHGKNIHENWYRELSLSAGVELNPPGGVLRPDTLEAELWHVANVFGPHLYNGCKSPFESMTFQVREWEGFNATD